MRNVPVEKIMSKPVVTVTVDEPFSHVEEKFRKKNIRHLPVVDEQNHLIGLITQRDLYRNATPHKTEDGDAFYPEMLDSVILKAVMTKDPHTVGPKDPVSKAVELMAMFKYGCVPVVDEGKQVVGIITEIDVLRLLYQMLREGESL